MPWRAQALSLRDGFFEPHFERPGTLLRLARYPPPPADGATTGGGGAQLRYGEHTDFDGFTILQREGDTEEGAEGAGGGLEIEMPSGKGVHRVTSRVGKAIRERDVRV